MFFFTDTAASEIYTLSLHDALPISGRPAEPHLLRGAEAGRRVVRGRRAPHPHRGQLLRSEEHTSELQSHSDLVCRLLLEKKKEIGWNRSPGRPPHVVQPVRSADEKQ